MAYCCCSAVLRRGHTALTQTCCCSVPCPHCCSVACPHCCSVACPHCCCRCSSALLRRHQAAQSARCLYCCYCCCCYCCPVGSFLAVKPVPRSCCCCYVVACFHRLAGKPERRCRCRHCWRGCCAAAQRCSRCQREAVPPFRRAGPQRQWRRVRCPPAVALPLRPAGCCYHAPRRPAAALPLRPAGRHCDAPCPPGVAPAAPRQVQRVE